MNSDDTNRRHHHHHGLAYKTSCRCFALEFLENQPNYNQLLLAKSVSVVDVLVVVVVVVSLYFSIVNLIGRLPLQVARSETARRSQPPASGCSACATRPERHRERQ